MEHDKDALLIPPCDSTALATAIRELYAHPEKCSALVDCAYKKVRGHFMINSLVSQYARLYLSYMKPHA